MYKGGDAKVESWAAWLIAGGALLIAEMLTLTFYLLWLGIGAVAASFVALAAPDAFVWQAVTGAAVALVLTVFTKPITRKFRQSRGYSDAIEELVGKPGIVVEQITGDKPGIVKVGNETWSAIAAEPIEKNEKVVVVGRGTAVLTVQKRGGSG